MSRVKIALPETPPLFRTAMELRISDINYGGHLGNDRVLGLCHEARLRFFEELGWHELDVCGTGIIMSDAVVVYKNQAFRGDVIDIGIHIDEIGRLGFDMYYGLIRRLDGKEIARARTGIVFFDYEQQKPSRCPDDFLLAVRPHG